MKAAIRSRALASIFRLVVFGIAVVASPASAQKQGGSIIVLTDGQSVTTSTFLHAPQGVLPPVRDGGAQADCDGKGLHSLELCLGGQS